MKIVLMGVVIFWLAACVMDKGSEIGNPLELTPKDTLEFHERQGSQEAACL